MTAFTKYVKVSDEGHLSVEGVDCVELAKNYGTPLFVISENSIRDSYREFYQAFQSRYPQDVVVCSGVKSNYGLAVRKVLVQEGAGADAIGIGELYIALLTGTDPEKIVTNGCNKPTDLLLAAIEAGIIINIDSLDELKNTIAIADSLQKKANITLRVRLPLESLLGKRHIDPSYGLPGIDIAIWEREFKFGMEPNELYAAFELAQSSSAVNLKGLMYHGGIPRRAGYFTEEVKELLVFVKGLKEKYQWEPKILDLGGGFVPERYGREAPPAIDQVAESITSVIKKKAAELGLAIPKLYLEPGRWIVEKAVIYLAKVGAIKTDTELTQKTWVYVNGNINEMLDPFDSYKGYHHVVLANNPDAPIDTTADVCGQLCDAGDILAKERDIPAAKKGDIVALLDMGAYNESFANQANAMPRSASVMVSDGEVALVRRRETIQDIIDRDVIPYWLLG